MILTIKPTGIAALAGTKAFRIKEISNNHVVLELVSDRKSTMGKRLTILQNN